jgi:ABC-type sugar transport system, periplasmic component
MYRSSKIKILCLVIAVAFLFTAVLAGCGKKAETGGTASTGEVKGTTQVTENTQEKMQAEEQKQLEPYNIVWYFPNGIQEDLKTVNDEVNKIVTEKINATVDMKIIDWGQYADKMNVLVSSGEAFDLCFTSSWSNYYLPMVYKNAYLPLDELIEKYAVNYKKAVPAKVLPANKVKGKTYAMIGLQVLARSSSLIGQKKYFDKYGVNPDSIKKLEDLTPLFEKIVQNEKGMYPIDVTYKGLLNDYWSALGIEFISEDNPAGTYYKDPYKVVNLFNTPEFAAHIKLMREWYQKGIIRKDAAIYKDDTQDRNAGKIVTAINTLNPDTKASLKDYMGDGDPNNVVGVNLSPYYLSTGAVIATMTAVSRTSKDPDRAVMFYDLLYSKDDTRLSNLIAFGVENKHYKKVGEDVIQQIPNSGYWLNCAWETGSGFAVYRLDPSQPKWDLGEKINEDAIATGLLGFSFDPTPVKSEMTQFQSVRNEYYPGLVTGSIDPDKNLPIFQEKMKEAGVDKIIAEVQKQINEWKASNQ